MAISYSIADIKKSVITLKPCCDVCPGTTTCAGGPWSERTGCWPTSSASPPGNPLLCALCTVSALVNPLLCALCTILSRATATLVSVTQSYNPETQRVSIEKYKHRHTFIWFIIFLLVNIWNAAQKYSWLFNVFRVQTPTKSYTYSLVLL